MIEAELTLLGNFSCWPGYNRSGVVDGSQGRITVMFLVGKLKCVGLH